MDKDGDIDFIVQSPLTMIAGLAGRGRQGLADGKSLRTGIKYFPKLTLHVK
ncbi:hypothetical protein [Janthinobacterium sp. TND4EL3]|uniref:hypothetical protein n=1 Tax=Janthinobacterium sp. TND4EL3 TaxID=1907311 RepID=UPI0014839E77|nr:hypothetical protein [Janthinobacterium sp. TND4EL3]